MTQRGTEQRTRRVPVWVAGLAGLLLFVVIGWGLSRTVSATSPEEDPDAAENQESLDASDVGMVLSDTGLPPDFDYIGVHWEATEAGEFARDRKLIPAGAEVDGRQLYYEQGTPTQPFQSLYLPTKKGSSTDAYVRYAPTQMTAPPASASTQAPSLEEPDLQAPEEQGAAPAAPAPVPGTPPPAAPGVAPAGPPAGAAGAGQPQASMPPQAPGAGPAPAGNAASAVPPATIPPGAPVSPAPQLPNPTDLSAVLQWSHLPARLHFGGKAWSAAGSGPFAEKYAMALTGGQVAGRPVLYAYGMPTNPYQEVYVAAAPSGPFAAVYVRYLPSGGGSDE